MTNEEAIRILDPETTLEALAEIEYYAGFSGEEAVRKAVDDACLVAVEALRYDVEAVVRELEKEREWNMGMYEKYNNIVFKEAADGLKDAIEIVKRGGRNEV